MNEPQSNRARRRRIYKAIAKPILDALADWNPDYGPVAPGRVRIRQAWVPPEFYAKMRWPDYAFIEGVDTPVHRPLLTELAPVGLAITWSGKVLIDLSPMSSADFRKEDERWEQATREVAGVSPPSQPEPKPPRTPTSTSTPRRPFLIDPTRTSRESILEAIRPTPEQEREYRKKLKAMMEAT